jgi:hypothetical protein
VTENEVAKQIVDAAYRVHTDLGPGLLESVYESVLAYELEHRGLLTTRQQPVPLVYRGVHMGGSCAGAQEAASNPSAASRQALGPAYKLQCGP